MKIYKVIATLLLIVCFNTPMTSYASCGSLRDYPASNYEILDILPTNRKGCTAKIYSKKYNHLKVYIPYNFVCSSSIGNTFEMETLETCCDMGNCNNTFPRITASPTSKGNESFIVKEAIEHFLENGDDNRYDNNSLYNELKKSILYDRRPVDSIFRISSQHDVGEYIQPYIPPLKQRLFSDQGNTAYKAAQILNLLPDSDLKKEIYLVYLKQPFLNDERKIEALTYFNAHPDEVNGWVLKKTQVLMPSVMSKNVQVQEMSRSIFSTFINRIGSGQNTSPEQRRFFIDEIASHPDEKEFFEKKFFGEKK